VNDWAICHLQTDGAVQVTSQCATSTFEIPTANMCPWCTILMQSSVRSWTQENDRHFRHGREASVTQRPKRSLPPLKLNRKNGSLCFLIQTFQLLLFSLF
jgi:hypothetical protein